MHARRKILEVDTYPEAAFAVVWAKSSQVPDEQAVQVLAKIAKTRTCCMVHSRPANSLFAQASPGVAPIIYSARGGQQVGLVLVVFPS